MTQQSMGSKERTKHVDERAQDRTLGKTIKGLGPVVDWAAGTPGKSRWAGPPEWVIFWLPGPLAHYNKLTKFRNI